MRSIGHGRGIPSKGEGRVAALANELIINIVFDLIDVEEVGGVYFNNRCVRYCAVRQGSDDS